MASIPDLAPVLAVTRERLKPMPCAFLHRSARFSRAHGSRRRRFPQFAMLAAAATAKEVVSTPAPGSLWRRRKMNAILFLGPITSKRCTPNVSAPRGGRPAQ